jgi:hypothetical protein
MSPWKEDQAEFEQDVRVCDCERGFDELEREVSGELGVSASGTGNVARRGKRQVVEHTWPFTGHDYEMLWEGHDS